MNRIQTRHIADMIFIDEFTSFEREVGMERPKINCRCLMESEKNE